MVTSEALTSQRGPSREGSGLTDVMQSFPVRQSSDKQPGLCISYVCQDRAGLGRDAKGTDVHLSTQASTLIHKQRKKNT